MLEVLNLAYISKAYHVFAPMGRFQIDLIRIRINSQRLVKRDMKRLTATETRFMRKTIGHTILAAMRNEDILNVSKVTSA